MNPGREELVANVRGKVQCNSACSVATPTNYGQSSNGGCARHLPVPLAPTFLSGARRGPQEEGYARPMSGPAPRARCFSPLLACCAFFASCSTASTGGHEGQTSADTVPDAAFNAAFRRTGASVLRRPRATVVRAAGWWTPRAPSSVAEASGASEAGVGDAGRSVSCGAAQIGQYGDFKGYRMFPPNHPINTPIDTLPVSAHSADWLANCSSAHPYLQLDLSMPYGIVAANTPPVTATHLDYNATPYPNPWPFPVDAVIEQGDGHCLAFDVGNCKLYEVYNFAWGAGMTTFTGGSGTVWDTTTNDPGNGSGFGRGGLAHHPLAHSLRRARRGRCNQPRAAVHVRVDGARAHRTGTRVRVELRGSGVPANPHDPTFPPMGMRVRLKASYDPTAHSFPPPIVAILKAIQKYGLLLADNGSKNSPMYITGASDMPLSDALSGPSSLIKQITTADLEVADTGR